MPIANDMILKTSENNLKTILNVWLWIQGSVAIFASVIARSLRSTSPARAGYLINLVLSFSLFLFVLMYLAFYNSTVNIHASSPFIASNGVLG